jgi:hypothetical protein
MYCENDGRVQGSTFLSFHLKNFVKKAKNKNKKQLHLNMGLPFDMAVGLCNRLISGS